MRTRTLVVLAFAAATMPAMAQDGLRLPSGEAGEGGSGIDPSLAGGWLSPARERKALAPNNWRDAIGFAPTQRIQWSYPFGEHSFGMSLESGRDFDASPIYGVEARQYGLFGRYRFSQDWSLSAETYSRAPGAILRLQDLRIGLRRRF